MPSADLSPLARQALIALLLSGRDITNPMLIERFHLDLRKATRDLLIEGQLLVMTGEKIGRALSFRLTEEGRGRARAELSATAPTDGAKPGAKPGAKTGARVNNVHQLYLLYAVANVLDRVMQQYGLDVEKIMQGEFEPQSVAPERELVTSHTEQQGVEGQILSAYAVLAKRPGDLVSLVRLRHELSGIDRETLDTALKALDRSRVIQLESEPNRKALPAEAHAAAIRIGGEDKHFITVGHR